jgi:hypothetical protein
MGPCPDSELHLRFEEMVLFILLSFGSLIFKRIIKNKFLSVFRMEPVWFYWQRETLKSPLAFFVKEEEPADFLMMQW